MANQVVLGPSSGGGTDLRIQQAPSNPVHRTPPGSELHLGSQDLIRLASYATVRGFAVSSFMLADAYLAPIGQEEQAKISDGLVNALTEHGGDEVEAAMQDEFAGLYVVGVNLINASTGRRISVRRRGFIETSVVSEAESLLRSAWRELRLS